MNTQRETMPVGTIVTTRTEYPGVTVNNMTHGYLPAGAVGTVIEHTQDGRAVVHFPGYGYHTAKEWDAEIEVKAPLQQIANILSNGAVMPTERMRAIAEVLHREGISPEWLNPLSSLRDWPEGAEFKQAKH